ncbi:helix-turn-helix transcriptional regulator [Bradyrhizobium sp. CCGUVB14]|uniref:helix-turn-helix domain-containing protein n=1 Tax=Bradyrhizobium sp. CCGUVB14 TaxID=2949628 RepID=UPI0020B1E32D|nr:helix-turn-helix transcriptional regulator [Bradyrhizobium sp. CCGUVB14]MCP3446182.1 helix-turn-helix domain-containing protein [Bradyrhizobium sp. CCGUVB14]
MNITLLAPKMLGFWARCVRDAQHLSQDALAANASVNIRTVQRFESGQPINVMSRRAIAKALGYDDPDIFDDPKFIESVLSFFDNLKDLKQKQLDDQHPDQIRVKANAIASGEEAVGFADTVNAASFTIDADLSEEAKELAAAFWDYLRDLMDVDDIAMSCRLALAKDVGEMLNDLRSKGASVYSAIRDHQLRNDTRKDQSSWPVKVGFLAVVPADRHLEVLYVPKRTRFA